MRLSIKGMVIASGLLWGGVILFVGLINLARPAYGTTLLTMISSVYPWYHVYPWFRSSHTVASVVIGTIDGLIDGAIAGCFFGWLYNTILDLSSKSHTLQDRQT